MRYDLNQPLLNYNGQLFTRPVVVDGQTKQEPLTLRDVLESACLNADPNQHSTGTQKMVIFNVLMKVHKADPVADLTAEDVALLKELVGKQITVAAVGMVYAALEKPLTD